MPPWLGTLIVLAAVGAMVGGILYSMIRNKKNGKSGCSCGCANCKFSCPSKQKNTENGEDLQENAVEKQSEL